MYLRGVSMLACAALAVALAITPGPVTARGVTFVRGADDPAVDVPAVQAAADRGGLVFLLGTFDFGETGRVILTRDVDLLGWPGVPDPDADGQPTGPRATIKGGDWTLYSPPPAVMPPVTPGPQVTVRNVHFTGARGVAIHLAYTGGCLLAGNRFTALKSKRDVAPLPTTFDYQTAVVIGPDHHLPRSVEPIPLLVSGDVKILRNDLDVTTATPTAVRATGIFVSMYVGADVVVRGNRIWGFSRNGVNVLDGLLDAPGGRGGVVIAENEVESDVVDGFTQAIGPRAPNGILVGFNNDFAKAYTPDPGEAELVKLRAVVTRNRVELHGRQSLGITNIFNRSEITDNVVDLHREPGATSGTSIGILATTSDQVITGNRILGAGCNAVRVGGLTLSVLRTRNLMADNSVVRFFELPTWTATDRCADYRLDLLADGNTLEGSSGTFLDEGAGNSVSAPPLVAVQPPAP